MVALTSRVAVIAASISLTAILNAPTVEGIAIPSSTAIRSQELAHQAMVREESPVLDLPQANGDSSEEQGEREDKRSEKGGQPLLYGELLNTPLFDVNLYDNIRLKRSTEQTFFHIRRGYGLQVRRRSSLSRRFLKARDEGDRPPGHIELQGLESKKKYGSLFLNPSNGDIDASVDEATIWYRISVPCPDGSSFKHCVSFAMFDTSDKNRCITYTSSSKEPSRLHGDYCWDQTMANEEAAVKRSQTFGYEPRSGQLEPLHSSHSSSTASPDRREDAEEVTMIFRDLEQNPSIKSDVGSSDSSSTPGSAESTVAVTSTDTSSATAISTATDTSIAAATSTETTTLIVTVTADSEPTSSPTENLSTASTTAVSSPTQTSAPLKVKVFGNTSSPTVDTASAASTTSAPASTITPNISVDGDVIASSIAAEDSSSSLASTTTAAARR